jgi:hypothetical protein
MAWVLWLGMLGAGWAAPPVAQTGVEMPAWGLLLDQEFEQLKEKADAIRADDFPPQEKARQLLKLVKPGLTPEQVQRILGEKSDRLLIPNREGGWRELVLDDAIVVSFDKDGRVAKASVVPDKLQRPSVLFNLSSFMHWYSRPHYHIRYYGDVEFDF